jgi:ABC-type multidrug transport system ATPase subunit
MQDDALLANLTVRETLLFTLALRVPDKVMNAEQRHQRVQSVLADLNLLNVADSRVCRLTQQARTAVRVESKLTRNVMLGWQSVESRHFWW